MQRCCSASRSSTWSSPGRAPGRSTRSCARRGSPPQVRQAALLPALRVEVLRIEPGLEGGLGLGPLAVEDREPRSVAVAALGDGGLAEDALRSEEHTSELQSLMRISYAVFCLKKKKKIIQHHHTQLSKGPHPYRLKNT